MAWFSSQPLVRHISYRVAIAVAALAVYCCNRYVFSFDSFLPYSFAHYHLNDLCGGVVFPAYVDGITYAATKKPLITSFVRVLLVASICSLCWEVISPQFLSYSTGDIIDVAMYFCGCAAYYVGFLLDRHLER